MYQPSLLNINTQKNIFSTFCLKHDLVIAYPLILPHDNFYTPLPFVTPKNAKTSCKNMRA